MSECTVSLSLSDLSAKGMGTNTRPCMLATFSFFLADSSMSVAARFLLFKNIFYLELLQKMSVTDKITVTGSICIWTSARNTKESKIQSAGNRNGIHTVHKSKLHVIQLLLRHKEEVYLRLVRTKLSHGLLATRQQFQSGGYHCPSSVCHCQCCELVSWFMFAQIHSIWEEHG